MSRPMTVCITNGVVGDITRVNRLRKKRVAFGFKTFVKKPILTASKGDRVFLEDSIGMSILPPRARSD